MRFAVSGQYRRVLARGAAVFLMGGLAAGCSSDVMRFEESILTGNSHAPQQQVAQSYPGAPYGVDHTSTGSISSAPRRGGLLNRLTPRPRQDLGGQYAAAPSQNTWQQPAQVYPAPSSPVSSGPALAPVVRSSLDPAPTGSVQPAPAPAPAPKVAEVRPSAPNTLGQLDQSSASAKVPTPSRAPGDRAPAQQQLAQAAAPAPAAPAMASASGNAYKVASGDTLHSIARRFNVSVDALKRANGLNDGNIRIGQTLTIPAGGAAPKQAEPAPAVVVAEQKPDKSTVTSATPKPEVQTYTPPKKSSELPVEKAAIDRTTPAPNSTGISGMRWPVRGRVISAYSASGTKKNDGIDIAVPAGTPIKAAENGVVIYAGDGLKEFGNTVLVRHDNGLVTVYGHASELKVQRGQKVRRGEEIALAGMSGSADMPKLHFEVRKDSTPVDPTKYLE